MFNPKLIIQHAYMDSKTIAILKHTFNALNEVLKNFTLLQSMANQQS